MEAEFTGAIPPAQVEEFFDGIVPSEAELAADAAVASGDEDALRAASGRTRARRGRHGVARILIERGDSRRGARGARAAAGERLRCAGAAARARLGPDLAPAFDAWDDGDHAQALELLQNAFAAAGDPDERDAIRQVMVAIFTELGAEHPLAREHRRRLSSALY